jgi:hypothetical protein
MSLNLVPFFVVNLNPKHGYTNPHPKGMLANVKIPNFEIMKHLQSP